MVRDGELFKQYQFYVQNNDIDYLIGKSSNDQLEVGSISCMPGTSDFPTVSESISKTILDQLFSEHHKEINPALLPENVTKILYYYLLKELFDGYGTVNPKLREAYVMFMGGFMVMIITDWHKHNNNSYEAWFYSEVYREYREKKRSSDKDELRRLKQLREGGIVGAGLILDEEETKELNALKNHPGESEEYHDENGEIMGEVDTDGQSQEFVEESL
jgi:hypothetical protein